MGAFEGIAKKHVSTIDVAVRRTNSDFKISRVYTHTCGSSIPGMNAELELLEKGKERERAFLTSRGGARRPVTRLDLAFQNSILLAN